MTYDVFISFKNSDENGHPTKDSELAKKLYDFLTAKGLNVFFSNVVLEYIGSSQFTKVINQALDASKILVAVGTSTENLDSKWVNYEWESFLNDINIGRKPNAEVFVLYSGITINDLPRALRMHEAFDAGNKQAFERLYNFIHNALAATGEPVAGGGTPTGDDDDNPPISVSGVTGTPKPNKSLIKKTKVIIGSAAALVVVAALVFGGMALWGNKSGTGEPGVTGSGGNDGINTSVPIVNSTTPGGSETAVPTNAPSPTANSQDFAVGNVIHFGNYDWVVLDVQVGKALIITRDIVEQRAFNDNLNENGRYDHWETCSLRKYLNTDFYNSFTTDERAQILDAQISDNTIDKIFLLSKDEVEKYLPVGNDDAVAYFHGDAENWWMRESSFTSDDRLFGCVDSGGYINTITQDSLSTRIDGVRPAMWIKLDGTDSSAQQVTKSNESVDTNVYNLSNGGKMLLSGNDVYYSRWDGILYKTEVGKDDNDRTAIYHSENGNNISCINIDGDTLYFYEMGIGVCEIGTDGQNYKVIEAFPEIAEYWGDNNGSYACSQMILMDDNLFVRFDLLYYHANGDLDAFNALYEINITTGDKQQINKDGEKIGWITAFKSFLYFILSDDFNDGSVMMVKSDSGVKKTIAANLRTNSILIDDNFIYFFRNYDATMYRAKLDGTDVEKISTDCGSTFFTMDSDWVYYQYGRVTGDNTIYAFNKATSESVILATGDINDSFGFYIIGRQLYYLNGSAMTKNLLLSER